MSACILKRMSDAKSSLGSSSYYVTSFAHLTLNDYPIDLFAQDGKAPSPCSVDPPPVPNALGQIPECAVHNVGLKSKI